MEQQQFIIDSDGNEWTDEDVADYNRRRKMEIVEIEETTDYPDTEIPYPYTNEPLTSEIIEGWKRIIEELRRRQNLY